MTIPHREIQKKIRDIILADTFYSSLQAVIIGYLFRLPDDMFPNCTVVIPGENEGDERTGVVVSQYTGSIRFDVKVIDDLTVTNRAVDVPSYMAIEDYIHHTKGLFRQESNINLQGLNETDVWAVRYFQLLGEITYGIDSRIRENDYENFGSITFICEVQEKRT